MKTRVLCFGAHPDDIEIGCGATIALLAAQGAEIQFVVATLGEQGSTQIAPAELAKKRREEARASAKILGAREVIFLELPDGAVARAELATQLRLTKLVREFRPDSVFVHASCDSFPDHAALHRLALAAVGAASGPWFPEAGKTPHAVAKIYGYEVWHPIAEPQCTVAVDAFFSKKLEAIACHETQRLDLPYEDAARGLAAYRALTGRTGKLAEAFEVLRTSM